jgi:outer membrane protein
MNKRLMVKGLPLCILIILLPIAVGAEEAVILSLEEAVSTALGQNLQLDMQKQEFAAAQGAEEAEHGVFDSYLTVNGSNEKKQLPILLNDNTGEEKTSIWSATLAKKIETGTELDLTWENQRYSTNSLFINSDPTYGSLLSLGVSQPLLKGRKVTAQTSAIRAARNNAAAAANLVDSRAADLAAQVKKSYWELVFARQDIEVKKLSLSLAEKLLEDTRRKINAEILAPVEIYEPESEVARREEVLIGAERAIAAAEDTLKILLNYHDWNATIVPSDAPDIDRTAPDLAAVLNNAMTNRPDIRAADLQVEAAAALAGKAADNLLPSLDISGRAGFVGTDTQYDDSLDRLFNGSNIDWRVGIILTLPLGNSGAKGNWATARAQMNQAKTTARLLRQEVTRQAREAVRDLNLSFKSIEATRKTTLASRKRLEAEQDKFEEGLATALDVLEAQESYALALINEKRALIDSVQARAEVERIQGLVGHEKRLAANR